MVELIVLVVLTTLGYVFGRRAESKHFESIRLREAQYRDILIFNERHLPTGQWHDGELVGEGDDLAHSGVLRLGFHVPWILPVQVRSGAVGRRHPRTVESGVWATVLGLFHVEHRA